MSLTDLERLDILFGSIARGELADMAERRLAAIEKAKEERQQRFTPSQRRPGRKSTEHVVAEIISVGDILRNLSEVAYVERIPEVAGSFRVGVRDAGRRTKDITAHIALHADSLRNYRRKQIHALGLHGQALVDHFLEQGVVLLHARMANIPDVFRQQVSQLHARRYPRF